MDEQDLLDLKQDIDKAKDEVNRLEGRQDHLLQQLEEDWGCETVEEAEEKLAQMDKEIKSIEKKIEKGTAKIEEKYEFE